MDNTPAKDIILRKKNKIKPIYTQSPNLQPQHIYSDEPEFPDKITHDMAQQLITLRTSKQLTRKDLGIKTNISEKLIVSYETIGTILTNIDKQNINKIKNVLINK